MNKRYVAIITALAYFVQMFIWVPGTVVANVDDGKVVDAKYKEQQQTNEAKSSGDSEKIDWSKNLIKQVKNLELGVDRSSFVISQDPELTLRYKPSVIDTVADLFQKQASLEKRIAVMVRNSDGEKISEDAVHVIEKDAGSVAIVVDKEALVPDTYSVEVLDKKGTFIAQNFSWGVLAINTNKSVYLPGDTVALSMAVLDNEGEMVCDANVDLTITSPSGVATRLTSSGGGITVNEEVCQSKDFTLIPDYQASFHTTEQGDYALSLSAETHTGTHTITDQFAVKSDVLFDVERISATRLYPVHLYPVLFRITPKSDYKGPVTEQVPSDFVVSTLSALDAQKYTDVATSSYQTSHVVSKGESSQTVTWSVDWKAGKTYILGYRFDALDKSPDFYTLGPLAIGSEVIETRMWQLAIDFVSLLTAVETDATGISENLDGGGHNMVFIDDQTGYIFFNDNGPASYRKTTNGGVTWGSPVTLTAQTDVTNIQIWYDRWTPGNTGDLIHVVFNETGGDDIYYENVDTGNSDTQKGEVVVLARGGTTHTGLTDSVSITRATDGDIYVAVSSSVASSAQVVRKSVDVGDNWTDTADEGLDVAADAVILMPLASADILLLRWDISAEDIQSKEYDEGANTWTTNWTDNNVDTDAADSTVFTETWSATVHPSTNDIYLSYVHTAGVITTPEVRTALYNGSTWSAKTDVIVDAGGTNSLMGTSISLDSTSGDVYVAYLWGTSAGANNARYKLSSDFTAGSPTWSAEFGPIINIADDMKGINTDAVNSNQIGLWAYNDDTADIWYGQIVDIGAHVGAQNLTNYNGFESRDSVDANAATGTLSYSTSIFRSGDTSLRTNPTAGTGFVTHALTYGTNGAVTSTDLDTISGVVGMYVASGTTINQQSIVLSARGGGVVEFEVSINADQTLSITNDTDVNGSYALVDDTWYVIAFGSKSVDLPNQQLVRIYSSDMSTLHETITQTGQTVADFDDIRIGPQTAGTTANIYWDDFAVDARDLLWNFPLIHTDYRIEHMALDAVGTDTAWANDYTTIDEIPTNSADYIQSTAAGEDETSSLESAASAGIDGTPIAVRVMNTVWEAPSTVSSVRSIRLRDSGVDETVAVDTTATAGTEYVKVYTIQPTSLGLWTSSALDSLEVGVANDGATIVRNGASVTQVMYEAPPVTTITISGTANGNDGATVMVAVAGSVIGQTDTISSSAWEITGVAIPDADDNIVAWVDNVSDANESSAVTKWSAGDVTGMVLDTNVLTVGSSQDSSLTVTDLNSYDCTEDEDVMYQAASSHLKVEGDACAGSTTNSYSAEEIEILSGDTLTVGGSETLTTYDLTITGTLTSSGNSTYNVARNWAKTGTFTSSTSTVNLNGASATTQTLSGNTSFNNLTAINAGSDPDWLDENWDYRLKLTIEADEVDADLTDFPVYVNLADLPSSFHSNVNQTDARDIRVTKGDGTTEIPREVVFYTAASDTGELHFQYSGTLSGTTDTEVFIYYGNASASDYAVTDTYGAQNVWDSDFAGVWHLQETSGTRYDSTGNDNDLTAVDTVGYSTSGALGTTVSVPEGDGHLTRSDASLSTGFPAKSSETTTSYSTSFWLKATTLAWNDWLGKSNSNGWGFYDNTNAIVNTYVSASPFTTESAASSLTTNTWYHISGVHNATSDTDYVYVNGSQSGIETGRTADPDSNSASFMIGGTDAWPSDSDGLIDEVRVSVIPRSATWTSTEYNNQFSSSTFYSEGTEESPGGNRTIRFTAGSTQTVTGTWTVTGAAGSLIVLESSTTSAWAINPTAAAVTYVSVSYSTNTGVSFCATNSTDGGNNTDWSITSGSICQENANSFQRKTWYDGTRYWRSSRDAGNARIMFEYSADGSSWTENTSARITVDTADFSIEADSSNLFVVYRSTNDIKGRAASSYPGTGFSWGSEETVLNGSGATDDYGYPVISRDSSGYVWVGARFTGSSEYFIKTIKETGGTNDLPEDSGDAVYDLANVINTNANVYANLVSLGSQNMYMTFVEGTEIQGCRWVNASTDWQDASGSSCVAGAVATPTQVSVSTSTNTTNTSDELIDSMTVTPGVGNYLVTFSTSIQKPTMTSNSQYVSLYLANAQIAHTERYIEIDSSYDEGFVIPVTVQAYVTVSGGSDAIEARWRTSAGTATALERSLIVQPVTAADMDQATATDNQDTTSGSDVLMPSMTLTPGAGDYMVYFSGSIENSAISDTFISIYSGNSQVAHTERVLYAEDSFININNPVVTHAYISGVGASDDIEIRWRTTAGTATVAQRTLIVQKVNPDIISQTTATADTSTTSTSYTSLGSMTLTPGAGDYLVYFSGSINSTADLVDTGYTQNFSLYADNVVVAHSEREIFIEESMSSGNVSAYPVFTQAYVTVGGGEAIEVQWKTSGGTMSGYERTLTLVKITNSVGATDAIATGTSGISTSISSVSDSSGNVHLVFINDSGHTMYRERTTSWQTAVTLDSNAGNEYPTISYNSTNNDLYAFWIRGEDIFYKKGVTGYLSGDWDVSATSWQTTGANAYVTSNYVGGNRIFAQWYGENGVNWDVIVLGGGNNAPGVPTVLYVNERATTAQAGVANPVGVGDGTPVFSAIYNDDDSGDIADKYQVIVYSDISCTAEVWDSGATGTGMTNCTQGNRCGDVTFGGTSIALDGATYYWKIKFWDDSNEAGTFSDCSATVTMVGPNDQMRHGNYFFNQSVERTFTW